MQVVTLKDAFLSNNLDTYPGVYVFSDADTCFYVGISNR